MTEIPEHLLKRSRERKAAMSGESGDSTPAETSAAVEAVTTPAAATPAVAATASVPDIAAEPELSLIHI